MKNQQQGELKIELGLTYRDKVTSFEGVATECRHLLGGQIRVVLEGADSETRNRAEGYIFDGFRLELVSDKTIDLSYPTEIPTHSHSVLESTTEMAGVR